jgi:hypothetical protein
MVVPVSLGLLFVSIPERHYMDVTRTVISDAPVEHAATTPLPGAGPKARPGMTRSRLDCPTWNHPYLIEYEYDPDLECFIYLDSGDELDAYAAVSQIGDEFATGDGAEECRDIEEHLLSTQYWFEWTGWYQPGDYNWDAATRLSDNAIGFHYQYITDSGLWAHEGAHSMGDWDDGPGGCPNFFQVWCPDPPDPCWEPILMRRP